jgi:hypothetical protein
LDAADQKTSLKLIVNSLGRGPLRCKFNCDSRAVASYPSWLHRPVIGTMALQPDDRAAGITPRPEAFRFPS